MIRNLKKSICSLFGDSPQDDLPSEVPVKKPTSIPLNDFIDSMGEISDSTYLGNIKSAKTDSSLKGISVRNEITKAFIEGVREYISEYGISKGASVEIIVGDDTDIFYPNLLIKKKAALIEINDVIQNYERFKEILDNGRNQMDYDSFSIIQIDDCHGELKMRKVSYQGGTSQANMVRSLLRHQMKLLDPERNNITHAQSLNYLFYVAPENRVKACVNEGDIVFNDKTIREGYNQIALDFRMDKGVDSVTIYHPRLDFECKNTDLAKVVINSINKSMQKYSIN